MFQKRIQKKPIYMRFDRDILSTVDNTRLNAGFVSRTDLIQTACLQYCQYLNEVGADNGNQ